MTALFEFRFKILGLMTVSLLLLPVQKAEAGPDPFVGELGVFATTFCPRGWVEADGQLLEIEEYKALYSLLGTVYGGDGTTTFALPDLRGRTPVHQGKGRGLKERKLGETNDPAEIRFRSGNQSIRARTPYLVLRYCIAYTGVYPARD